MVNPCSWWSPAAPRSQSSQPDVRKLSKQLFFLRPVTLIAFEVGNRRANMCAPIVFKFDQRNRAAL